MTKNLNLRRRLLALVLTVALVATSVFVVAPENAYADVIDDGVADIITLTFTDSGTATIYNEWTTPIIVNGGDIVAAELASSTSIEIDVSNGTTVTITESENGTFRGWNWTDEPLVKNVNCALTEMPEMGKFTSDITGNTAGDRFFFCFNYYGSLTSLPEDSFDTSNITTVGSDFFYFFNRGGELTSLPVGSFDISSITTVGGGFFFCFNSSGKLTSLPEGSFDTSSITTYEGCFFSFFNSGGALTSLPAGSFDISNITTSEGWFFNSFNERGSLTSLPEGSFDISDITTVGGDFFSYFNYYGLLTSLLVGSFDTSGITTVGDGFFRGFNCGGALTSLPAGSFDTSSITIAGGGFFSHFNDNGALVQGNKEVVITNNSNQVISDFSSITDLPDSIPTDGGKAYINTDPLLQYTVTFDANGGSAVSNKTVKTGDSIGTLPTTTRNGYIFDGWWTAKSGGTKISASTKISNNITFYAHWKEKEHSISETTVAKIANQTYTGKVKKPTLTVKHGSTTLTLNTHYTVKHSTRTAVGKANITITGKGNYTGTKTVSFKIVPKTASVSKVTPAKKQLKITWGKVSGTTKYEVRYRVKGASNWTTKTVAGTSKAYTAKSLKKGKAYQVQVRFYKTVSGVKYYSAWSKTKTSGKVK